MSARHDAHAAANAKRLCQLRQLRQTLAERKLAQERRVAHQHAQAVSDAQNHEQRCLLRQKQQAQQLRSAHAATDSASSGLSVSELQHELAWSQELRHRSVKAQEKVQIALGHMECHDHVLQQERQAYLAAHRGVDQSKRLQQRITTSLLREREIKQEDILDELALVSSSARRAGPTR